MGLVTQIGSAEITTSNKFAQILEQLGVQVSEPTGTAWNNIGDIDFPAAKYETSLRMFRSIAASSFHIIDNHASPLTEDLCLQILYAMRNSKPIILTGQPSFDASVGPEIKDVIRPRMSHIFLLDPEGIEASAIEEVLESLPTTIAYGLSDQELATVRFATKRHFRHLLQS